MLNSLLGDLLGWGSGAAMQQPQIPGVNPPASMNPAGTPGMPVAQPAMTSTTPYGPPMPNYDQSMEMGRMQGQPQRPQPMQSDLRQQMIMRMLQQGMGSQGQGQGTQAPPMSLAPGRPGGMQMNTGATQSLMQNTLGRAGMGGMPGGMMRRPLGMGGY